MITVLSGHVSPETAYEVANYPYGFKLKCTIRYWLETHPKHGVRLMTQTTNPKKPGWVWNKPKASTYARFGGAMYLDDAGHCQWSGLTEYTDGNEARVWRDTYGQGVPDASRERMEFWVKAKLAYDAKRAAGASMATAGASALVATAKGE